MVEDISIFLKASHLEHFEDKGQKLYSCTQNKRNIVYVKRKKKKIQGNQGSPKISI